MQKKKNKNAELKLNKFMQEKQQTTWPISQLFMVLLQLISKSLYFLLKLLHWMSV
jgi:hypothetical protein